MGEVVGSSEVGKGLVDMSLVFVQCDATVSEFGNAVTKAC